MTSCLIVEDDPIISEDLRGALSGMNYLVLPQAYDANTALALLSGDQLPHFVLLDIDLGGKLDGIDVAQHIRKHLDLPFIFLTSFADRRTLARARETQPNGYIVKPYKEKELFAQIEIALYNHQHRVPEFPPVARINQQLPTPLTDREYDLLRLLYEGHPNRAIATELEVSTNTVKTHLRNLFVKLDANSRIACLARLREMM